MPLGVRGRQYAIVEILPVTNEVLNVYMCYTELRANYYMYELFKNHLDKCNELAKSTGTEPPSKKTRHIMETGGSILWTKHENMERRWQIVKVEQIT